VGWMICFYVYIYAMYADLTPNQKMLTDFMSELSEKCYYAGWMINLEYVLWDAVINGEREYGIDKITQADIDNLTALSKLTKGWIYYDNHAEETAISIDQWLEKFKTDTGKDPGLIVG
jgi:hypothetical protein